jgi:cyanophycin synthetase
MVENIMAAILAAYAKYINIKFISQALRSFKPNFENMPGRMNYMEFKHFSFLLDYAHNFHGLSALGDFIREHDAIQKVGIVSAVGDRRDIDIFNMGKASAELFDKVIIRIDEDTRGRNENEIVELIYSGIAASGKHVSVEIIKNEFEAIRHALFTAMPGSLIVLLSENIKEAYNYVRAHAPREKEEHELMLDEQANDEREFNF